MNPKLTIIVLLMGIFVFSSCQKDDITPELIREIESYTFLTEDFPPFNYLQGSSLNGVSVDLLQAIWNEMGVDLDRSIISIDEWSLAYNQTLNTENTMLFSTGRIVEREDDFKWVGPITPIKESMIALAGSSIKIENESDLKNYKIAVIEGYSNISLLNSMGVNSQDLNLVSDVTKLYETLINGEVDLIAFSETTGNIIIQSLGYNQADFKSVFNLETTDIYYAFNKQTSKRIIDAYQNALNVVINEKSADGSSEYEKILNRYSIVQTSNDEITNEMVIQLVNTTVDNISSNQETTIEKINNGEAPYKDPNIGSLYAFVYDTLATIVAHPTNPSLVGVSLKGKADVTGKNFRDDIVAGALENGNGWVDYIYTKPNQGGLYQKTTYYKLAQGNKGDYFVVCAGKYK